MLWHLTGQTPRLLRYSGSQARIVSSFVLKDTFKIPPLLRRPSSSHPSNRRRVHLSSTNPNPIQISADRKSITFHLAAGETTTQRFAPTPKISSEKLERALRPLLSTTTGVSPRTTAGTASTTSTTGGGPVPAEADEAWLLDPEGDAIHRHFVFASEQARENAVGRIMQVADEMKHHPHMARGGGGRGEGDGSGSIDTATDLPYYCLTVTCTTHQPTGLSGKDARLAARIDELSLHSHVEMPTTTRTPPPTTPQDQQLLLIRRIHEEQSRLIQVNRDAIAEALESCGCSVAKAAS